jgi:N-acetylglucosaminyldiphosphoundecaprenol N-acetyl-beta-D-mannosaminyltransferase
MPISVVTEADVVEHIVASALAGQGGRVITPNLEHLRLYRENKGLRPMFEKAELVTADGMPLVWASRLQHTPLPQRVSGSALIYSLTEAAAKNGLSVYFLGGNPGAADKTAEILAEKNSGLKVAGTSCPFPGFDRDPRRMAALRDELVARDPRIVYIGLGFPKQEWLIEKLRAALPRAWFLGIGISFSFVCGEVKRAPLWMQRFGMEWLHRLMQEPERLARRYIIHGLPFAAQLFFAATAERFRRNKSRQ